jgi:hypothetical protein
VSVTNILGEEPVSVTNILGEELIHVTMRIRCDWSVESLPKDAQTNQHQMFIASP